MAVVIDKAIRCSGGGDKFDKPRHGEVYSPSLMTCPFSLSIEAWLLKIWLIKAL